MADERSEYGNAARRRAFGVPTYRLSSIRYRGKNRKLWPATCCVAARRRPDLRFRLVAVVQLRLLRGSLIRDLLGDIEGDDLAGQRLKLK
jgi:hypothetical protein